MNKIYVVEIRENTGIAKLARAVLKFEYSHITICLDEHLTDFITFSRRKYYLPLDSGFMRETRNCFGDMDSAQFKAKVFEIEVSENELYSIKKLISEIEQDKDYIFNVFAMITMPIFHGFELYKTYNCISFVGRILKEVKSIKMTKPFYKYTIQDIDELLTKHVHFEGMIDKDNKRIRGYMEKYGILTNLKVGRRTLGKLFVRLFKKHKTV